MLAERLEWASWFVENYKRQEVLTVSDMDGWNIGVLVVAGYVAVISLVRLMKARHSELLGKLRGEFEQEKARLDRERRKQEKKTQRSA